MYDFNNMELEYNELYLDSTDSVAARDGYSNKNWPLFYLDRPLYNVISLKVLDVQIPFSYFVINNFNNSFVLTEKLSPFQSVVVTIPVGNYNVTTFATALQTALNQASYYEKEYTVTFDQTTQRFKIFGALVQFRVTFGNNTDPGYLAEIIGLPVGTTDATPEGDFGVNSQIVCPFSVQLTGPNYLYLCSDAFGNTVQSYVPQKYVFGGGKGPQIAKVPVNVNPNDVIYYNDPDPEKWFEVNNLSQLSSFDLYVLSGGLPYKLDFNGHSFSVKLGVYTLKK